MKWLAMILLLANLLYFGWEFSRETTADVGNSVYALQVPGGTSQLQLISELKSAPVPRENAAPGISAPEPEPITEPETLVAALPEIDDGHAAAEPVGNSCFTFGPLPDEQQAIWLGDWFRARRGEVRSRQTEDQNRRLFWVYLAPAESRAGAEALMYELQKKGVSDYRLISKGGLVNAISLGLFSSQAAVNDRLSELKEKGYQPIVVPYSNVQRIYWLDVMIPGTPDLLDELFKGYPSQHNSVPVQCSEIAMDEASP